MRAKILPYIKGIEHATYVEPFGGGATMLLAKEPSKVEVYNDIDHGLFDFFSVLADSESFGEFNRRVALLPYSREFYNRYRKEWKEEQDRIKRVAKWFLAARQSFSGAFGVSWSLSVTETNRNMANTNSKWLSAIDMLPEIHKRLQRVQIECNDWRKVLETYDTEETLFYLDPPYVPETRSAGKYKHELTTDDHIELVDRILLLKGSVILSGYNHEIYKPLDENGFRRYDFNTACHATGKTKASGIQGKGAALEKQARVESLWVSAKNNQKQMSLF